MPEAERRPTSPTAGSCQLPAAPAAEAWGPGRQGLWGGGHGAAPSSLGVRGLWALVQAPFLVAALLGPVPPLPGPLRRTRQPLGGGGRGKVGGGRAGLSPTYEGDRGHRCWWGGLLAAHPYHPEPQGKTLVAQKGELAPQGAAGCRHSPRPPPTDVGSPFESLPV